MNNKSKTIYFDDKSQQGLLSGVNKLADAVSITLGAKGRNVIIEKEYSNPIITKDGVTVAKEIFLDDKLENMGAQLVKGVAMKTAIEAGDGTTTATILTQSILSNGLKAISTGANPIGVKRGIDKGIELVVNYLQSNAIQIGLDYNKIKQIATISANNDSSIGELIAEIIKIIGIDGVVSIEEGKSTQTELRVVEGLQIDSGYLSQYFITDQHKLECVLENPYILLLNKKISTINDILPILEKVVSTGEPLLIIADDVESEALATLVVNRVRAGLKIAAIKSPSYGDKRKDILTDIAILTNGTPIFTELGLKTEDILLSHLGRASKVIINKDTTVIIDGKGEKDKITERAEEIKTHISDCKSDYDKEKLQERLGKLIGGIVIVQIGASSEIEIKEKKDRVDDAMHATRAAVSEGIIPGGGTAYLRATSVIDSEIKMNNNLQQYSDDEIIGLHIIKKSLEVSINKLCYNAGISESSYIKNTILNESIFSYGYNLMTNQFEDLIITGIIDPVKVARIALMNAGSIASMLLTTNCAITINDIKEKETEPTM